MKTKEISIKKTLSKERCIDFFLRYGFFIYSEEEKSLIMKKAGREFTTSGEKLPKKLSVLFQDGETVFKLQYDMFILFDTGDLKKELDAISTRLNSNLDKLM
ncbi:hypothetical protein [Marivirga sericea]|nr:hypothetical protein [Marivirga sericea]